MSFLNTIRGFGRSTKKNKKDYEPQSILYQTPSGPTLPLRRPQPSGRTSPSKQRASVIQFAPLSPTKSTRQSRARLPQRNSASGAEQTTEELPLFLCQPFVNTALVKGSFKTIVQLPKYVDYGEWLSLNIFEMYGNLNQFYGVISEYVTPEQYPTMNAGPDTNYMWKDNLGQAVNLPACQYIDYVLTWISNKLNDQSVFPTRNGGAFPPTLVKDCKNIARQMFRIFAHIYHNHFDKYVHLSLEAHWNSFFAHFISVCKEFNLIERSELAPLLPLIENFEQQGKII
ncbi:hypothetical protein METBIDRAFT_9661 [Metschnikowia bicuspidata var. bicuspidata NRRL YB-4993]|uniref:Mob1/phocein n=1 Tax=Metschnikowia bicuspidata var. bicuspidata NRRL YB-4993 TaxID=869754 RepID=A0A1A0HHB4_9ASCO|nr:hypothetical protein METBIDRAFT_9661 [Metschnikowia bicuspidata var. bicuspidata NRRL YB-4993]OBA23390.1 hypothetical protein METBIDRAFT_9661 [Metschnikowia bicuspidata var. bicuspidata NRRL YB-4993]